MIGSMPVLSLAARFKRERDAHDAYAQMVFYEADHLARHKLSITRLWSAPWWYVVVVGEADGPEPFQPLVPFLKKGKIVPIADETIDGLMAKRTRELQDRDIISRGSD